MLRSRSERLTSDNAARALRAALASADAGINQRELDVLERGSPRNKIETLKDKSDILIANIATLAYSR